MYVRKLNCDDTGQIERLFKRCGGYFQVAEGKLPEAGDGENYLKDCPPGKVKCDKTVFGIFDGEILCGTAETVRNYPDPGEWMIGLLLVDPEYRLQGIGRRLHDHLAVYASDRGCCRLRIGVIEYNLTAFPFWEKLGYRESGRTSPRRIGRKTGRIVVMNLWNIDRCRDDFADEAS